MSPIVFVTTELPPDLPGGAGFVINDLATRLGLAGHEVVVLLCSESAPPGPPPNSYKLEHVAFPSPVTTQDFVDQSKAIATRLSLMNPRQIEFHDFNIPGFWTLTHRHDFGLMETPIAIRFHGPVAEILVAVGQGPEALYDVAELERQCLTMADVVVVPSESMRTYVTEHYLPHSVFIGPLPLGPMPTLEYESPQEPHFVFYGRTNEVKGPDIFLEALSTTGFDGSFIGNDGWSLVHNRPMSEVLGPTAVHRGPVDRFDLDSFRSVTAVVIPSRFESFCLAAYEARAKGLPIIVSDLPAFKGLWDTSTGALVFDGSTLDLATQMQALAEQPELARRLARSPLPEIGDPLRVYTDSWPVRHRQSQAGLATAALAALGELNPTQSKPPPLQRALRLIPAPMAGLAVRVLPQKIKNRFRKLANWNIEASDRAAQERRAKFQRSLANFKPAHDPDVSVIIPCYNQGNYLMDAIMSVFEQSHDSFEIIVVDDGSTDPQTTSLLDSLALPATTVIRQPNVGLPGARNAGIRAASGEFIVALDADDELKSTYLSELLSALRSNSQAGFAHCWAELYGDVEYVWATRPFNLAWMLVENSVVGCTMIRAEALDAVGLYDETMTSGNEDWELWIRLAKSGWESEQVRKPLFRYRKHGHTMSVDTESAFVAGRKKVLERVGLDPIEISLGYAPVLGYISSHGSRPDGVGEVVATDDLSDGVRASRAKYLTVSDAPAEEFTAAVRSLEADSSLANATVGAATVWRRWALLDTTAGHVRAPATDALSEVRLHDWELPTGLGETMRQLPEVPIDAWDRLA